MARILVIDDEPLVRVYLREGLCAAHHTVYEAEDGASGMAAVRLWGPDLIVCDLFMPNREGIETIRKVRGSFPALPVIAISGGGRWGMVEALRHALALGASSALAKPVHLGTLLQTIDQIAGRAPTNLASSPISFAT